MTIGAQNSRQGEQRKGKAGSTDRAATATARSKAPADRTAAIPGKAASEANATREDSSGEAGAQDGVASASASADTNAAAGAPGTSGADRPPKRFPEDGVPKVGFREVARKFIGYYKPYTGLFVLDLVCASVVAAIDLAFPQILNFFVEDFFVNARDAIMDVLPWVFLGLVALYALRTLCQYFISAWGHIMGARMEANMRQDLFRQYQRLSFSYYDRNNTGEMMSKLVTDLFDVSELAHHGPENIFIAIVKVIGSFVLLMSINVPLTLIMLAVTAVMAAYSIIQNYRKRVIWRKNNEKLAGINARTQDSLGGIRVVKGFGNEDVEIEKFNQANSEFVEVKEQSYRFMGQFQSASSIFTGALYTTTIVGGGYFVAQGMLDPADLVMYALYIGIFIAPIDTLIEFTERFQKGYAGFRRFVETLAEQPGVQNAPGARDICELIGSEGAPSVRYRDVHFSYEEGKEVLHGLDLELPAGKTVALVGPSGGGKTTTCSLLPRFYDVDSGSVEIDGVDVRDVTLESLRDQVGIVQQDVYIFEGTIRDNILYGDPNATQEQVEWAARQANIHDFIMSLDEDYDTCVGERGARLSGGQKQRIAIARVFLRDPRILILDEATSSLDNESEERVQESLERLSADRTTLVIAHRLSTIRNADLIAVVDEGRVVETGTHDELMARGGIYRRYYDMQFERHEAELR